MVLVRLTDTKTSLIYQLELSEDNFQRAQTDNVFRKKLLADAIKLKQNSNRTTSKTVDRRSSQEPNNIKERECKESLDIDFLDEKFEILESIKDNGTNPLIDEWDGSFRWGKEAISVLLSVYREKHKQGLFSNGRLSQRGCWELISRAVASRGPRTTWQQCHNKFNSMKKMYRKIKLGDVIAPNNWEYYDKMEEIFDSKSYKARVSQKNNPVNKPSDALNGVKHSNEEDSKNPVDNASIIQVLERHLEIVRAQRTERENKRDAERRKVELQRRRDRLKIAEEKKRDRARLIKILEKQLVNTNMYV